MITFICFSCGRLDLLERTISSFWRYNTMALDRVIIVDDSGNKEVHDKIKQKYSNFELIMEPENRGYIKCIDHAYSCVKSPYIFHTEDDWEYCKSGFMEKSYKILETIPNIIQVWLRGENDTNTHPVEPEIHKTENIEYKYMSMNFQGIWHGFSFNPSLRRKSDYEKVAPYVDIRYDDYTGNNIAIRECHIGWRYKELGFRAVTLIDKYCTHIGWHDSARAKTDK